MIIELLTLGFDLARGSKPLLPLPDKPKIEQSVQSTQVVPALPELLPLEKKEVLSK